MAKGRIDKHTVGYVRVRVVRCPLTQVYLNVAAVAAVIFIIFHSPPLLCLTLFLLRAERGDSKQR